MDNCYLKEELLEMGFVSVGENVAVSKKASIYVADNMSLGNHVRIDDFCVLSGNIVVGSYVHISPGCVLISGCSRIVMNDFSGLSSKVSVYAASDDYSGEYLANPTIPGNISVYSPRRLY